MSHRRYVLAVLGTTISASLSVFAPAVADAEPARGRIRGLVVNAATGEPVAGAYVGAGDFGDSGGSNYERHIAQGLHAKAKTDAAGRFELSGLAFTGAAGGLQRHPIIARHPLFVPLREDVALPQGADAELTFRLVPGAALRVRVVDLGAAALPRQLVNLRIEARDGHRFIPPDRDPHLGSFASSAWSVHVANEVFEFRELAEGEYSVDAFRIALADLSGRSGWASPPLALAGTRYIAGVTAIALKRGETTEIHLRAKDHGTRLEVRLPGVPADHAKNGGALRDAIVLVSRNSGILVWDDGRSRGPEDDRLGRLVETQLFWGFVPDASGKNLQIDNLPPGRYAVFAGPAVFLRGAPVDLKPGEQSVEIAWREPRDWGRVRLGNFRREVSFDAPEYDAEALCERLTAALDGHPKLRAAAALRGVTLGVDPRAAEVWDVIERLHVEHGITVEEDGSDTLILRARRSRL